MSVKDSTFYRNYISNIFKPTSRWDITGTKIMSTYSTTWMCNKCRVVVSTRQPKAGFIRGYGTGLLKSGPCPCGGDHDWHELTEGTWSPD